MEKGPTDNLELFYDCLDESTNILYDGFEKFHKAYFDLLFMTFENIISGEVKCECEPDIEKRLTECYKKISNVDFSVEDVRKAIQAIVLKGFKEMRLPNGNTTPDTLGMLVSYLIDKVFGNNKKLNILDPLCGTGNLLFTVADHLSNELSLVACDHDPFMAKLTGYTAELLNQPTEILLQDTMNLQIGNIDAIVFDLPNIIDKKNYEPYKWILHYSTLLNDKGLIVGIVSGDFFDYDKNKEFRKKLLETMSILGFIELPDDMFVGSPKCIIVLQKVVIKDNKCFMIKLPSFTNVKEFNSSLQEIELWFDKYKKNN